MSENIIFVDKQYKFILDLIPMGECLVNKGKSITSFTSEVFCFKFKEQQEQGWVLKPISVNNLREAVAERAAYKFSNEAGLGIVPETKIGSYKGMVAIIKPFIDSNNHLSDETYKYLLASNNDNIKDLKNFWFVFGQWDTSSDNAIYTNDGRLISIDNTNIANIQKVGTYGEPHFVKTFFTSHPNEGSIEQADRIIGPGKNVLEVLNTKFGENAAKSVNAEIIAKKPYFEFTYFVNDNYVWRNHYSFDKFPNYFVPKAQMDIKSLEKFTTIKNIDCNNIFKTTLQELQTILEMQEEPNAKSIIYSLDRHFDIICEGINQRYDLAYDYLVDQYDEGIAELTC